MSNVAATVDLHEVVPEVVEDSTELVVGAFLSEAALWSSSWQHTGLLSAATESRIFQCGHKDKLFGLFKLFRLFQVASTCLLKYISTSRDSVAKRN